MEPQHVEPAVGEDGFNCPTCAAYAHQTWHRTEVLPLNEADSAIPQTADTESSSPSLVALSQLSHALARRSFVTSEMLVSRCEKCGALAVWMRERVIWPCLGIAPPPSPDLPEEIRHDYREASRIARESPRGAAALLRLAVENLCKSLVSPNKNLNDCIRELVRKGLDRGIQQALDTVRVVGNNAVHPGKIDLRDDSKTVAALFRLVNFIAEQMVTGPKNRQEIYDALPADERSKIERRDGNTA